MFQKVLVIICFHIILCDNVEDFLLWSQKSLSSKWTTSYILSDMSRTELLNVTHVSNGLFNLQSNITHSVLKFGDVLFIEATTSIPIIELSQKDFTIINTSESQQLDKAPLLIADGDLIYRWTKDVINLLQQYDEITILPINTDDQHHYESSCKGYSIFILDPRCSVKYVDNSNVTLDIQTKKCLPYSIENIPYKSQIISYIAKSPLYFKNKAVFGLYTRECTQKWVLCGQKIRIRPRIIVFVKRKKRMQQKSKITIPPLSTFNHFCSCSQYFTKCQPRHSDLVSGISALQYLPIFIAINERRACYTFKDCYYFKSVSNMYKEITDIFNLNIIPSILPINVTYVNPIIATNRSITKMQYTVHHMVGKINSIQHIIIGMSVLIIVFLAFLIFMLTTPPIGP